MPGVAGRELSVGAECFLVENGDLLPECSLRHYGEHRCTGILKYPAILLGGIGCNFGLRRGCPGGKRADFQSHHGQNGGLAEQLGISEIDGLGFVFVDFQFELVREKLAEIFRQLWNELLPQKCFCFGVEGFVQLILLIFASLCPGVLFGGFQQSPVQDQINFFREAMDQIETFGQAGTALKCQMAGPGTMMKQVIQSPANPEILFHDAFAEAAFGCSIAKQDRPFFLGKLDDGVHFCTSLLAMDFMTS